MRTPSTATEVQLSRELWESSSAAWLARVPVDANRSLLLDPVMLSLVGPPGDALDVGCGEGRFCRMLAERGFRCFGLDPTVELLAVGKSLLPSAAFLRGDGASLPFRSESFDLTISYLSLLDIPDYRAAICEMARVTRPGGRILVANCTAMCTALPEPWQRDESGERLFVKVDRYMEERAVRVAWSGIDILNYHRPLSAYFSAFLSCGLRLEHFSEPVPSAEALKAQPWLADHLRVPNFYVMLWRKE